MRSGKLIAKNDYLVEEMINDPDYKIMEDGSISTLIQTTGKRSVKNNWRPLLGRTKEGGYVQIPYKHKKLQIHRIIYRKFIGPLEEDLVINHKDGDPTNNVPSNLELVPQGANNLHSYRDLNRVVNKRTDVLNFDIAEEIRELKKNQGLSHRILGEKFGISKSHVSEIINRKIWTSR